MFFLTALLGLLVVAAAPAFAGTLGPTLIPEPMSLAMLAIGVAGVAVVRAVRNRRK